MNIQVLKNKDIQRDRWDSCVAQSTNETPYGYSYYLDIVCPQWKGIVLDDYQAVCALPLKTKWGIKYLHQPSLLQRVALFGNPDEAAKKCVAREFLKIKMGDFNMEQALWNKAQKLINIELNLNQTAQKLKSSYSDNCSRNIKKALKKGIKIEAANPSILNVIVGLFKANRGKELDALPSDFYGKLQSLCEASAKLNKLEVFVAKKDTDIVGGIIIISSEKRKLLLFTAADSLAKNTGAMHLLVSNYLEANAASDFIFDFEGSMNEGVARFYKGFGGQEEYYYHHSR